MTLIALDAADLEIPAEVLVEILDLADVDLSLVWPRFQLRPARPCFALQIGDAAVARFLIAAGAVLDYDHAVDLFAPHHRVERGDTVFYAFPEVLVAGDDGSPDFHQGT